MPPQPDYTALHDPELYQLAEELAQRTGEPLAAVVKETLRERIDAEGRMRPRRKVDIERLRQIADQFAALPVLDPRSPEEIIGYDEHGVPR